MTALAGEAKLGLLGQSRRATAVHSSALAALDLEEKPKGEALIGCQQLKYGRWLRNVCPLSNDGTVLPRLHVSVLIQAGQRLKFKMAV